MAENRRNGGASVYSRHLFGAGFPSENLQLQFSTDPLGEYITIYPLTVIGPTPKGMGEGGFTSKGDGMMEGKGGERGRKRWGRR